MITKSVLLLSVCLTGCGRNKIISVYPSVPFRKIQKAFSIDRLKFVHRYSWAAKSAS